MTAMTLLSADFPTLLGLSPGIPGYMGLVTAETGGLLTFCSDHQKPGFVNIVKIAQHQGRFWFFDVVPCQGETGPAN